MVETFEAAESNNNQNFRTLFDFSMGRIDEADAFLQLGIDSQEDLFLLMTKAHLPMPRINQADTQLMADQLLALV